MPYVLSMGGSSNTHTPGRVCGITANGRVRCGFEDVKSIDRQLYVADNCNAPSKFTIDGEAGAFGPLLLHEGSADLGELMCIDCTSEQACHAAKRSTATCTMFKVDAPEGDTIDDDLKLRLVDSNGKCLDCPWQTVFQSGSAFKFRNDQGYGGDRECRLNNCYRDNARFSMGMTFKQRTEEFVGAAAGTPEPRRMCSTADGKGALFSECKKYGDMCDTYETHHAYCELKKTNFIEDTLKPTIHKVATYWDKLSVEAESNMDAARGSRENAIDADRKKAHQEAQLLTQISDMQELVDSVTTRYENCLVLNYPKSMLLTFEMEFSFCVIGFCFEKDPIRMPFVIPMGDNLEDISEMSGGGTQAIEKYIDDLLYGLHEANQDEAGMQEILDATFNFEDLDNTMTSVHHESECFDVAGTNFGISTLGLIQASCDIDDGQALNRFGIKLDEEQCGTGRGVVWWSCVNALSDSPGVCSWNQNSVSPGAFDGTLANFVFKMECPDGTLLSRISGSSSEKLIKYQCCTALVQHQDNPTNCVTVEPAWPGAACSAEDPVGTSTSLADFSMYEPLCDRETSMLDWQKTGGRVAMTSYTSKQVQCSNTGGSSIKVSVTCCKVLSSRSVGFDTVMDKVNELGVIEWRFTAWITFVRLKYDLGEIGNEDIYIDHRKNWGGDSWGRIELPLVDDVETDYFIMQPLGETYSETDSFYIQMEEEDSGPFAIDDHVASKTFNVKDVAEHCQDEKVTSSRYCCAVGIGGTFCVIVIPEIVGMK